MRALLVKVPVDVRVPDEMGKRRMNLFRALVATALLVVLPSAALADESFSVIFGGKVLGHLTATTNDGETRVDFDYKNNGRGPTLAETIRLDGKGLPTAWTIEGATTFGSKVDEHFEQVGDKAQWTDSVGSGSLDSPERRLYIGQGASPWALGVYARALLGDIDHTLPTLPGGSVHLDEGEPISVSNGKTTESVRSVALSGLELNPSYLLLDEKQALFAYITPTFVIVRKGFEGEEARLRGIAAQLSTTRFETTFTGLPWWRRGGRARRAGPKRYPHSGGCASISPREVRPTLSPWRARQASQLARNAINFHHLSARAASHDCRVAKFQAFGLPSVRLRGRNARIARCRGEKPVLRLTTSSTAEEEH